MEDEADILRPVGESQYKGECDRLTCLLVEGILPAEDFIQCDACDKKNLTHSQGNASNLICSRARKQQEDEIAVCRQPAAENYQSTKEVYKLPLIQAVARLSLPTITCCSSFSIPKRI